jgi:hypothetical protein
LQVKERAYQLADGGGLYVEARPTGKTVWRALLDAQIEEGRKVVIGRFGKACQAA